MLPTAHSVEVDGQPRLALPASEEGPESTGKSEGGWDAPIIPASCRFQNDSATCLGASPGGTECREGLGQPACLLDEVARPPTHFALGLTLWRPAPHLLSAPSPHPRFHGAGEALETPMAKVCGGLRSPRTHPQSAPHRACRRGLRKGLRRGKHFAPPGTGLSLGIGAGPPPALSTAQWITSRVSLESWRRGWHLPQALLLCPWGPGTRENCIA